MGLSSVVVPAVYSTELGYAERTTNDTTTNTAYASTPSNKISGLSVTVVGTGQPVRVSFFCTSAYHSVADKVVNVTLLINGAVTSGQIGATGSAAATPAANPASLYFERRILLTAGTSYTFEVGKYVPAAGTGTYAAAADAPMSLTVSR